MKSSALREVPAAVRAVAYGVFSLTAEQLAAASADSLAIAERGLRDLEHNAYACGDSTAALEFHLSRVRSALRAAAAV